MAYQKVLTVEKIREAIPGSMGNRAEVARRCGVCWRTIAKYFKENPELQELLEDENEAVLDVAEKSLLELVKDKDFRAIKFVLTTHGKHRGYATRTEVTGADGGPITIRYVNDWRGAPKVETESDVNIGGSVESRGADK